MGLHELHDATIGADGTGEASRAIEPIGLPGEFPSPLAAGVDDMGALLPLGGEGKPRLNAGEVFLAQLNRARARFRREEPADRASGDAGLPDGHGDVADLGGAPTAGEPPGDPPPPAGEREGLGEEGLAPFDAPRPLWRHPAVMAGSIAAGAAILFLAAFFLAAGDSAGPAKISEAGAGTHERGSSWGDPHDNLMAPAAKLASVLPREPGEPAVREIPAPQPKGDLVAEVTALGLAPAVPKAEAKPLATVASPEVKADAGQAAGETGVPAGAAKTVVAVTAQPPVLLSIGPGASGGASPFADMPPVALPAIAAEGPAAPVKEPVGLAGPGGIVETVRASSPAAVKDSASLEIKSAEVARPENDAIGLVTQLGTLVTKDEKAIVALRKNAEEARAMIASKFADLERRVNLSEARLVVALAKDVNVSGDVQSPPPPALVPASVTAPAPLSRSKKPGAIRTASVEAAAQPASAAGEKRRYKVQAASPGLAMLAEIDRSEGDSAQLQVAVGDRITGYGQVKRIVQHGTAWVVETDQGSIQ